MSKDSVPIQQLGFLLFLNIWVAKITLPFWLFRKNFTDTLLYFDVDVDTNFFASDKNVLCKSITSMTKKPWFMRDRRCLRQGLLAMRFLRKAGYSPVIHFGINSETLNANVLSAHCWVELDGISVMNDILEDMVIVHSVPVSNKQA